MEQQRLRGRPPLPRDDAERLVWAAAAVAEMEPRRGELERLCRRVATVLRKHGRLLGRRDTPDWRAVRNNVLNHQRRTARHAERYQAIRDYLSDRLAAFVAWSWDQLPEEERVQIAQQGGHHPCDVTAQALARQASALSLDARRRVILDTLAEALLQERTSSAES